MCHSTKLPFKNIHIVLTQSCPEISLTYAVWTYDTFENNFEINKRFKKYFKRSSYLVSDEYFSFKYFLKFDFVGEISPK